MAKEGKKKKSLFRRIFKWFGILLVVIIAALIIIPIVFKDEIKEMVLEEVNNNLKGEFALEDFDLTLLSTFPSMTFQLDGAKLTGIEEFEGVELANIKQLVAKIDLWDVIGGDQIAIKEIHLVEPQFNVLVTQDGLANYDITIPTEEQTPEQQEEPSNFKLSLQEYSITDAQVTYDDRSSNMYAKIVNLDHTGKGDLSADIIDFETLTNMDELTYEMDNMSYLAKVKTDATANILMEFTENYSKFTLKENSFKLNALQFDIDGFYQLFSDHDEMELKLNAKEATFKEFLSLIPAFYHSGYEGMIAKGTLSLNGDIKGRLDETNLPAWDFGLNINNASIKYPDLPGTISNIDVKAGSKFPGGDNTDKMTIDVDKFHAEFVKNTLDATLHVKTPESNPHIASTIIADVDLATIDQVIPMEGEKYSGKLKSDVELNGFVNDLVEEKYESFKAQGTLAISDMNYTSEGLTESVNIQEMLFRFAPQNLALEKMNATTGKSDFQMSGAIDNYLGYFFREELLKGHFNFNSSNLDLDQLMNLAPTSESETTSTEKAPSSTPEESVAIPANIDFVLDTKIGNAVYNGLDFKNVEGKVTLKDQIATLHNLSMNAMGGKIAMNGDYNTQDPTTPKANFGYDLQEIDIHTLATNFITVEKLAPISKYAQGKISSNLMMSTDLTSNLEPILTSLNGLGDVRSNSLSISGFKPLDKMSEVTMISDLRKQQINDFKAKFKFEDGKMNINPFDVKLAGMKTNVSGYTSLDQSINYDINMIVPKDKIPAQMLKSAEGLIDKANSASSLINVSGLPAEIPVKVNMLGTVTNPKVNTDFKEQIVKSSGNALKEGLNDIKDQAVDSVKNVINDKVDDVKEDVEAKKQQILADAQKRADQVKAEAKKSADKIRAEADKQYDDAVAAAGSNPIKKKAAEIAAQKVKDKAYEKADQVEAEGQKQADAIMDKARAEADKL